LHFTQANLAWVIDAYMIAFGSFLLFAGRLGDLIGRKRVFLSGLVVFTLASAACGLATDQSVLVAARFVQGLGGAVASAVILALIVTDFPQPRDRAIAMSVYTFVVSSGGSIGLLAGGALTQSLDWHWIFFVNVPIGIAAFLLGRALIEESEGIGLDKGIDWLGSILVTVALMIGVYAIVKAGSYGWGSAHTLGFGAVAMALLGAFIAYEARIENPIFPLQVLRVPGLAASSAVRGLLMTGMFSTFFLGVLYLEHVRGYGAMWTGLAFLPLTLALAAMSLGVTARIMARFGPAQVLLAGLAAIVAALLLLTKAGAHASFFPAVFGPFVLLGVGAGMAFLPLMTLAMANVPARDAGLASGNADLGCDRDRRTRHRGRKPDACARDRRPHAPHRADRRLPPRLDARGAGGRGGRGGHRRVPAVAEAADRPGRAGAPPLAPRRGDGGRGGVAGTMAG